MRLLILIVFLTGCGVQESTEPAEVLAMPAWNGNYDIITGGIYIISPDPIGELVESELMRVRDCANLYAPLGTLVIEHSIEFEEIRGAAWWGGDYEYIQIWDLSALGHELIHILLYLEGIPDSDNVEHLHAAFFEC